MRTEFEQGKRIVMRVTTIILLLNGVSIWLAHTWLLTWYGQLHTSLREPAAIQSARALRNWFITNQESFFTNHAANYAVVICCCLLLFIGFDWLRWLWALHWISRGLLGIVVCVFFANGIGYFQIIFALGLLTSLVYIGCGSFMLLSPSVAVYMHSLRPPYVKPR